MIRTRIISKYSNNDYSSDNDNDDDDINDDNNTLTPRNGCQCFKSARVISFSLRRSAPRPTRPKVG